MFPKKILKLIKEFGTFSSNVEKCEACWIGRSKANTDKPVQCKWISLTNSTIKIVKTNFSYNKLLEEKMNFYAIRTDCRAILNLWKQRFLSLAVKLQIFKSLIASKPVYVATMKHLAQEILDDLQSMHKDFIWDGKRAKIKHCTLIGNYIDGGLKDVDLVSKFTSLKFIWIRKMLDTKYFHPWVAIADNILRNVGGVNVFQSNLLVAPSRLSSFKRIPVFYKN